MTSDERLAHHLAAVLLANARLSAQVEALKAELEALKPKTGG